MKRQPALGIALASSMVMATLGATAQAQSSAESGSSRLLEEVTVTARRVEENLQKVPIAVTALDAKALEEHSVFQASDLEFNVPGLKLNTPLQRGGGRFVMRGQSTANGARFPGVQTLVAEVPADIGGSVPFYDLESVQVLKGPQGVAFGRNALGGAVLLYPAKPKDQYGAEFGLNFGRFDNMEVDAAVNVPVNDQLWLRAAGNWVRRDGLSHNVITGNEMDNRHSNAWRLSAIYKPTDWIENYTMVSRFTLNENGSANYMTALNPASPAALVFRQAIVSELQASIEAARHREARADLLGGIVRDDRFAVNMTTATLNDNLTLKNIFGWQRTSGGSLGGHDMDGVNLALLNLSVNNIPPAQRTLSDEIQLQGSYLDGRLNWITGAYWTKDKQVEPGRQGVNDVLGGITQSNNKPESESYAGFAQITVPLDFVSDKLSLTTGVRHTWDSRRDVSARYVISRATGERIACQSRGRTVSNCEQVSEGDWTGWSWAATFDYKASDTTLLYLAHRRGYKGGGFNPGAIDANDRVVDPEYVDDVEFGFKTDWSLGPVQGRSNLAVYHQWYNDIVRTEVRVTAAGPESLDRNVAKAVIRGGEFETTALLGPFELSGWLAYTDAILKESEIALPHPLPIRFFDVPLHEGMISGRYSVPWNPGWGDLSFMASLFHRGRTHNDQNAVSIYSVIPSYNLVNYQLDWREVMGSPVDLSFYVKNATDKLYSLGGSDLYNSIGVVLHLYGEPRTYGVQLRYKFGAP